MVALAMLALPAVLWFGSAALIARGLRYPGFLGDGTGNIAGPNVSTPSGHPYAVARADLGIDPDDFDAGMVKDSSIRAAWPIYVRGWIVRARGDRAVVVIPAAGQSIELTIPYIRFLHDAGFSVVALESSSNSHLGTDWGLSERLAASAAAERLRANGFRRVGALGISEGGAAAILAQADEAPFDAIVADSCYANLGAMIRRTPSIAALNPSFRATVFTLADRFWLRFPVDSVSPAHAAGSMRRCPLLIIQNGADPVTPINDGKAIADAAGANAEMWIAHVAGHGNAMREAPDEYQSRVTQFFKRTLK
jgi:dienelactone hydrolase